MYDRVGDTSWPEQSVFDLARWKNGLAFKNIDFSTSGRPVIKIAELKAGVTAQTARTKAEYDPSVHVRAGDMLFSWSGNPDTSIDIFRWHGDDGWLNQHIFKVTPKSGVNEDFLFFVLRWLRPRFAEIARNKQTTGLGHVTVQDLKRMRIALPDPHEQDAIVSAVSPFEYKIELNRRMNETLEAMAQAIFRDWFVDFGPTRRRQDGATDPVEIMGGLVGDPDRARELADLFPAKLGDDGLPEGWEEGDLGQYALLNPESWNARNAPKEVEYVDLANTKWGTIETTTAYEWSEAPSRARRIVRKGDTIVGTVRPGNGSYSYVGREGLTASTGFAVLRPKRAAMAELVNLAATSADNIGRLDKLADGGAYPAVRPDAVLATAFPVVSPDIVDGFSSVCAPLMNKVEHGKSENRTLAATRDLLLPKLMSGEIRVRDAEREAAA
jgi:type I restriction enzyme S subunit